MEVLLNQNRYIIMKCVSQQTKEFRFVELFYLLKKIVPERLQAEEVKITIEWLADLGLVRKKTVKVRPGQTWLFYQSCFDYDFLLSRTKHKSDGYCIEPTIYICRGVIEKLRYKYAWIKEKINYASMHLSYKSPFIIAELDFAIPITLEEKKFLKVKIEELDK